MKPQPTPNQLTDEQIRGLDLEHLIFVWRSEYGIADPPLKKKKLKKRILLDEKNAIKVLSPDADDDEEEGKDSKGDSFPMVTTESLVCPNEECGLFSWSIAGRSPAHCGADKWRAASVAFTPASIVGDIVGTVLIRCPICQTIFGLNLKGSVIRQYIIDCASWRVALTEHVHQDDPIIVKQKLMRRYARSLGINDEGLTNQGVLNEIDRLEREKPELFVEGKA